MSEIRKRIAKILEESTISFMEDVEVQPDLFGGEDTYYKDGKQALNFSDVLATMDEIAPDFDFVGQTDSKDLYWMIFYPKSGVKINTEKAAQIESELVKRFGKDNIKVRHAQSEYAPEIKKLYVGFVDEADIDQEEEVNESCKLSENGLKSLLIQKDPKSGKYVIAKSGSNGSISRLSKLFDTEEEANNMIEKYKRFWDPSFNAKMIKGYTESEEGETQANVGQNDEINSYIDQTLEDEMFDTDELEDNLDDDLMENCKEKK